MKKKFTAVLLVAMLLCMCVSATMFFVSAESTGLKSVSIRTDNLDQPLVAEESSPAKDLILFTDQSDGLKAPGAKLVLFNPNAFAVYAFDMDDSVQKAYLNIVGGEFTVSYSVNGSEYVAFEKQASIMHYGVTSYELNESNALAAANNQFKIKITNTTGGQIRLMQVTLRDANAPIAEDLKFTGNTLDATQYIVASDCMGTYFGGDEQHGMVYLKSGKSVTYGFNIASTMGKVKFNVGFDKNNAVGNNPKAEISTDGTTYQLYKGEELKAGYYYLKVSNEQGPKELMMMNFSLESTAPVLPEFPAVAESNVTTVRTNNLELPLVAEESSSAKDLILFTDQSEGLKAPGVKLVLFNPNASAVYAFDMKNDVKKAYLNIVGGEFTVSYSVNGSEYVALKKQPSIMFYGVTSYELNESNALAAANNQFKIKITNTAGGQIRLMQVTLRDANAPIAEDLKFTGNTLDVTQYIVASDCMGTYFGGDEQHGMVYLKSGKSVTYGFNIASAMDKFKFNVGFDKNNAVGNNPKAEISTDGTTYQLYKGEELKAGYYYLKVSNEQGPKELMMMNLSVIKQIDVFGTGENANKTVPVNEKESYFRVGTEQEKTHMFGVDVDFEKEFNATHGGMFRDGESGGYSEMLPFNARKLSGGQYLCYDFDLDDAIKQGKLKIYAGSGLNVSVSTDNGKTYIRLKAVGAPGSRGIYVFDLNGDNALAAANNQFRLVIAANAESSLFAIDVHEDKDELANAGVSLAPWTRDSLRYTEETNNLYNYYSNSLIPSYAMHDDSVMIFKVPFANTVENLQFFVSQCASVKVELSGDGKEYTTVIDRLLGGTGEVPYNTFDATSYLGENKTVWVRLTGSEGYVFDLGFSAPVKDTAKGTVAKEDFSKTLYSVSNNDKGIGQLMTVILDGKMTFKLVGEVVYKLDLIDSAYAVSFSIRGVGEQEVVVSVSADGKTWKTVGVGGHGEKNFVDYNVMKENPSKIVYVKLSASDFYFRDFGYTTEGIKEEGNTNKPYDDSEMHFDYDREVPGIDAYEEENPKAPEESSEVVPNPHKGGGCSGSFGGAAYGMATAVVLISIAAVALKRRSK